MQRQRWPVLLLRKLQQRLQQHWVLTLLLPPLLLPIQRCCSCPHSTQQRLRPQRLPLQQLRQRQR
jgi:hypothetical protein